MQLEQQIKALEICINLLCAERDKAQKKLDDIDLILNEDVTLSEMKFERLDKKRGLLIENIDTITYGIRSLNDDLIMKKHTKKIREDW